MHDWGSQVGKPELLFEDSMEYKSKLRESLTCILQNQQEKQTEESKRLWENY